MMAVATVQATAADMEVTRRRSDEQLLEAHRAARALQEQNDRDRRAAIEQSRMALHNQLVRFGRPNTMTMAQTNEPRCGHWRVPPRFDFYYFILFCLLRKSQMTCWPKHLPDLTTSASMTRTARPQQRPRPTPPRRVSLRITGNSRRKRG